MLLAVTVTVTTLSACSIKSNSPSSYTTNTTAESSSKAQATQPAEQNYAVTNGTDTYRGFSVNNILHSENNSDIHFNLYAPKTYDGSKAYALFITLPGYEGLYFQGVGVNIRQENFGFEAQKYDSNMIIVAPQLNSWDEDSADETIVLVEYLLSAYNIDKSKVYIEGYGQTLPYDGLDRVIEKMKEADTIVIGSPLYWHNICGSVRNVLDRFYGKVDESELLGRKLYFVFQGAAPEKWMLDAGEYTMKRFASLYGMEYMGIATNSKEAEDLNKTV